MRNTVREMIDRILTDKAERRRWTALGVVCSLVAVVTVFMALSFPSITVTGEDVPADVEAQLQQAAEHEAAYELALAEALDEAAQQQATQAAYVGIEPSYVLSEEEAEGWAELLAAAAADDSLVFKSLAEELAEGVFVRLIVDGENGEDALAVIEYVAEPEVDAAGEGISENAAQTLANEIGKRCVQVIYQDAEGRIVRFALAEDSELIVAVASEAEAEMPAETDSETTHAETGEAEEPATIEGVSAIQSETISFAPLYAAPISTPEQPANPGGNEGGDTGTTTTPIAYQLLDEGSHGNTTWKVEIINGVQTLTITPKPGTDGRMYIENPPSSLGNYNAPWYDYVNTIANIVVEDGVSEISYAAFREINHVNTLNLPDSVSVINGQAFKNMTSLRYINPDAQNEVNLPSGLTYFDGDETFFKTSIAEITFPDGIQTSTRWYKTFQECRHLTYAHIPDGVTMLISTFSSCYNLKEFNIPSSVTSISDVMSAAPVEAVYYDSSATGSQARNFTFNNYAYRSYVEKRTLYIGQDVNYVPRSLVEAMCVSAHEGIIRFKANSEFEMDSLEDVSKLDSPLSLLKAGRYHADARGALYRIDDDGFVELVYVPDADDNDQPITSYTVPASIVVGDGTSLPVTAVGPHCISSAAHLTSLNFAAPLAITQVAQEAFAQCPTLVSFNGESSVLDAKATLPNALTDINIYTFEFTGLSHDYIQQADSITIDNGPILGITVKAGENRTPAQDADGTYNYYTGEAAQITLTISNPNNAATTHVERVYMQFDDDDATISYKEGAHTFVTENGNSYTAYLKKADAPFTYYWEIETPRQGDTLSIKFTVGYPSPKSDGGELVITGNILTQTENAAAGDSYLEPTTSPDGKEHFIELNWSTHPDDFPVTKKSTSTPKWVGKSDDTTPRLYAQNIKFEIDAPRTGETLQGMGKDYVVLAEYTDTFTIGAPGEYGEKIKWRDDVLAAILAGSYTVSNYKIQLRLQTESGTQTIDLLTFNSMITGATLEVDPADPSKITVSWQKVNSSDALPSQEITSLKQVVTLANDVLVCENPQYFSDTDNPAHILNEVTLTNHYSHSGPRTTTANAQVEITTPPARLTLSKDKAKAETDVDYKHDEAMGGRWPYKLTVKNTGSVPYTATDLALEDTLSYSDSGQNTKYLYITPEGIARMYGETPAGEKLYIKISNATLAQPNADGVVQDITTVDGQGATTDINTSSGDITPYGGLYNRNAVLGSEDTTVITNSATIEFRNYTGDTIESGIIMDVGYPDPTNPGTTVTYSKTIGSSNADYTSVREALDAIGHLVVGKTAYYVKWSIPGNYTIYGGQELVRIVHSSTKDTFMLGQQDQEEEYKGAYAAPSNQTRLYEGTTQKLSATANNRGNIRRDFRFDKDSNIDEALQTLVDIGQSNVQEGCVIDYTLSFSHEGYSLYEVLPLVDHMQNSQALLVPVAQNQGNAQLEGLETIRVRDVDYYYLVGSATETKTYRNIYVGIDENGSVLCADTITVAPDATGGFDTIIKWYYKNVGDLENGAKEEHSVSIMGYARYDLNVGDDGAIRVNNEGYLNDHMGRRLWEHVGPVFSRVRIAKEVEDASGAWVKHTLLHEGDMARYRLTINNMNNSTVTIIPASYLKDYLPSSAPGCPWVESDIAIDYDGHAASVPTGSEYYLYTPDSDHPENQVLTWDNGFMLQLNQGINYIYVTLKMPTGAVWEAFETAYASDSLRNVFDAFGQDDQVSHDVSVSTQPLLQKSVQATYKKRDHGTYVLSTNRSVVVDATEDGLLYYANDDSWERGVLYAVTLYNDGPGKLYVNDIQDQLPEGFTFARLGTIYHDYDGSTVIRCEESASAPYSFGEDTAGNLNCVPATVAPEDGREVSYKSFTVEATTTENGDHQNVKFSISRYYDGSSQLGANTLSYDTASGKCYLLPGEALSFSYFVRTNDVNDTLDTAVNVVGMEYDDSLAVLAGLANADITANDTAVGQRNNEGGCEIVDAATVGSSYGFSSSDPTAQFLTSEVELVRGGIAPGITKAASKATSETGFSEDNPISAEPTSTITWKIVSTNAGTQPIQDYTLTDTIQAPYEIVGSVYLDIYQPNATSAIVTPSTVSGSNMYYAPLFTIVSRTVEEGGRTRVRISYPQYYKDGRGYAQSREAYADLYLNEDPITLDMFFRHTTNGVSGNNRFLCPVQIQMGKDANGNETLEIRIKGGIAGIPSDGGRAELTLDTKNPTSTYKTEVIYNSTWITPNAQYFSKNVNQGNYTTRDVTVTDGGGTYVVAADSPSVKNSAPIAVAFGMVTSSVKSVRELGLSAGETNEAYSNQKNDLPDRITLASDESLFRYRLEVDNTNEEGLYNMVLIDNLPERGDWHTFVKDSERLSAFNVSLADSPDFEVYFSVLNEPEQRIGEPLVEGVDYVVEFSDLSSTADDPTNPTAAYTQDDWRGLESNNWEATFSDDTRSVRIRLINEKEVPALTTLCVEFTCKVNDSDVEPGSIAWNSFGYTYAVETAGGLTYLSATPLDVGVRVPGVPSIVKQLKSRRGAELNATQDETFNFIVFEGDITALNLPDGFDETDLQIALYNSNKKTALIEITVQAGKSVSDPVSLKGAQDLWGRGAFELVHGERCTVYELNTGKYSDWYYGYMSEDSLPHRDRFYTFTYDRYGTQTITATNLFDDWDIEITKVGETSVGGPNTPLEGAIFALYGTGASMDETAYTELKTRYGLSQNFADISTIEAESGEYTYYLQAIAASDADGLVTFVGLGGSTYKVVELKAPNGYAPTSEVFKFRKPGASDYLPATGDNHSDPMDSDTHVATATVVNYVAYALPETGGGGTALFTFAGLALMLGAGAFYLRRRSEG